MIRGRNRRTGPVEDKARAHHELHRSRGAYPRRTSMRRGFASPAPGFDASRFPTVAAAELRLGECVSN